MSVPLDCPELPCWQALLDDTIPPDQLEQYERHLESCSVCQKRIDQDEEDVHTLLTLVRKIGDPTIVPPDPALKDALEHLYEVLSPLRKTVAEPLDLYFLRPGNRPNILGTLGNYEVEEVIGQGGMGVVLKAFDPALHRLVAIKVMAAAVAGSATARQRFTREAKAAAAVCHDHIVTVHGVFEMDGLPYLVMQYVAGESLQTGMDRTGPLELEDIVRIGLQTASGLAAAHAQGLIHRDIKPANLLLENGLARVRITDFGLARMTDDVQLTQNGVVAGTPEYMAPEQARGEPVDHRADLFSLGSVLYALCTGVPPFRGSTTVAMLRQVSDQIPTPIRELNPAVPAWLEALIARLMAKDPTDRFQSAAEVVVLLEGYLAHLRQPATVAVPELPATSLDIQTGRPKDNETERWNGHYRRLVSWFPGLLVSLLLGWGIAFWIVGAAGEVDPPKESSREYYQSFKGNPEKGPDLEFVGPDAEDCVHFEPAGLRITLPTEHPVKRVGTGLTTNFAIKGDFEITIGFEILKEPEPVDTGLGTGVFLAVDLDTPEYNRATLTRGVREGKQFITWFELSKESSDKPQTELKSVPTAATTGQLRLVRTGSLLSHYVAEQSSRDFILIKQHQFSGEDVKAVRIGGQTGGPKASLDARITDLRIHAGVLPETWATVQQQGAESKRRSVAVELLGLLLTFSSVIAFGVWLYLRQSRRAGLMTAPAVRADELAPPKIAELPVSFACSACGKNLKAKAGLAGKKVKCFQCGKPVLVPATNGDQTGRISS